MDLEPLRQDASEAYWETVPDPEQNILPPLKSSYSKSSSFSTPKAQYCVSLVLAFVLGAICTAALLAAQKRPEVCYRGLESVTDAVACTYSQSEFTGDLLTARLDSARELLSRDCRLNRMACQSCQSLRNETYSGIGFDGRSFRIEPHV